MGAIIQLNLKKTPIFLINDHGEVVVQNALLVEGEGLCAIYNIDESCFMYVATFDFEIDHILATEHLNIAEVNKEERLCSECNTPMNEGFYFESDGTQYCSETCLKKVISWDTYLELYDNGNGDAYWTNWE